MKTKKKHKQIIVMLSLIAKLGRFLYVLSHVKFLI